MVTRRGEVHPLALLHGRPLRVLHGTYEIAGQGMMLAHALREHGCDARSLAYRVDWDGRVPDIVVDLDRHKSDLGKGLEMAGTFARWATHFDVFHFHFGTSFLPRQLDLRLLRAMGKVIAFHFHGCEVRSRAHMMTAHRLATCTECDPFCRPPHQDWLRSQALKFADLVFFSTLDLAESVPGGIHLPLAMEFERWDRAGREHPLPDFERRDGTHGPVVIAHAPTNRLIKGTRHVEAAVDALRAEGLNVELRMIEKRPWAEMPEFLSGCDILVDQLMMGWYGLLAIEGMAEHRAVVSYIREDFRERLHDCPVVSAEPRDAALALRGLVTDPARRRVLGERGASYIKRVHDLRPVGEALLAHYAEAFEARVQRT